MEANTFQLNGNNMQITYSAQGNAGQPVLTYTDPTTHKTFQKNDIRIISAEIGQLVTVTLQMGLDQGTRMLSLLLPTVTVIKAGLPVLITAEGIVTTFPRVVVGANFPGPNETYQVEPLQGSAQFVFVQTAVPETQPQGA